MNYQLSLGWGRRPSISLWQRNYFVFFCKLDAHPPIFLPAMVIGAAERSRGTPICGFGPIQPPAAAIVWVAAGELPQQAKEYGLIDEIIHKRG